MKLIVEIDFYVNECQDCCDKGAIYKRCRLHTFRIVALQ